MEDTSTLPSAPGKKRYTIWKSSACKAWEPGAHFLSYMCPILLWCPSYFFWVKAVCLGSGLSYLHSCNPTGFEVDEKYQPVKPIGKGAYGIVVSAKHRDRDDSVAIKKVAQPFANAVDARRTLREIKLLRHFKHENLVSLLDIMRPASYADFSDVYLVYELMDTDLNQIIKSPQELTDDHVQYFIYQVLRGLKYIHSAHVLHRDLKPSNLLLNANCDLKICDFGLARKDSELGFKTEYVVTRWYRAPELLVSQDVYSPAIDVWSVGCILGELLSRKPLFPGRDYIKQLDLILQVLGIPSDDDLAFIRSGQVKSYIKNRDFKPGCHIDKLFPGANPLAVDLLRKMLVFNPSRRLTVTEGLEHPYMATLHDDRYEPATTEPLDFDFEDDELDLERMRQRVWTEMKRFHGEET